MLDWRLVAGEWWFGFEQVPSPEVRRAKRNQSTRSTRAQRISGEGSGNLSDVQSFRRCNLMGLSSKDSANSNTKHRQK